MEIFRVERTDSHGGSLRVFVQNKGGGHHADGSVEAILEQETESGVCDFETYEKFAENVNSTREKLVSYLETIVEGEKLIAGFGAPAKGNTLLNFCGLGSKHIKYIVDENPLKQGLFTPGTRIPVVAPAVLDVEKPDYILILAWNFAAEILDKTKKYRDSGVKFIVPLPEPRVI